MGAARARGSSGEAAGAASVERESRRGGVGEVEKRGEKHGNGERGSRPKEIRKREENKKKERKEGRNWRRVDKFLFARLDDSNSNLLLLFRALG